MHAAEARLDGDREIVLTRVYDAPRTLVWKAFTQPEHLARWWGPQGFATITDRMDAQAGGSWRYVMRGPDGREYPNFIGYLEVLEPERLVYRHGGTADEESVSFHVTVTFAEEARGRTRVTMRSTFPSAAARDFVVREVGAMEGGRQTLGRLAEHLVEMAGPAGDEAVRADRAAFTITRVFAAPRELVWRAWTERDHLARWFGPVGVTIPSCTLDLRPGGAFHYAMQPPVGDVFWGKWVFREIVPLEKLVFVASFADEKAEVARHAMVPAWPLLTLSTITFADHAGIGRGTAVIVRTVPLDATEEERRAFLAGHASMQQGWGGTLDRCAAFLAQQAA